MNNVLTLAPYPSRATTLTLLYTHTYHTCFYTHTNSTRTRSVFSLPPTPSHSSNTYLSTHKSTSTQHSNYVRSHKFFCKPPGPPYHCHLSPHPPPGTVAVLHVCLTQTDSPSSLQTREINKSRKRPVSRHRSLASPQNPRSARNRFERNRCRSYLLRSKTNPANSHVSTNKPRKTSKSALIRYASRMGRNGDTPRRPITNIYLEECLQCLKDDDKTIEIRTTRRINTTEQSMGLFGSRLPQEYSPNATQDPSCGEFFRYTRVTKRAMVITNTLLSHPHPHPPFVPVMRERGREFVRTQGYTNND